VKARAASTLAGTAVVVAVVLAHRGEAATALAGAAPLLLAATVLLHAAVLALRGEIWGATLAAIEDRRLPRATVHAAASAGAVAGVLSSHLTLPTRVATVRRRAPHESPRAAQLVLTDAPLLGIEAACAALLLPVAAIGLPAWELPLPLLAVAGALVGLRLAHRRFAASRLAAGLAVLADRRGRRRVALLGLVTVVLTLLRLLLILWACGMEHGPAAVALTYIASSVLGVLPIGPATSLGATVIAAGAATAQATAAGVLISASSVGAAVLYFGVVWVSGPAQQRRADLAARGGRPPAQLRALALDEDLVVAGAAAGRRLLVVLHRDAAIVARGDRERAVTRRARVGERAGRRADLRLLDRHLHRERDVPAVDGAPPLALDALGGLGRRGEGEGGENGEGKDAQASHACADTRLSSAAGAAR
jgi:hypothetical protein